MYMEDGESLLRQTGRVVRLVQHNEPDGTGHGIVVILPLVTLERQVRIARDSGSYC